MSHRRCLSSSKWVAGSSCRWGLPMRHSSSLLSKRSHRVRRGYAPLSSCTSCPLPGPRTECRPLMKPTNFGTSSLTDADLVRFGDAQVQVYRQVVEELIDGRKQTHWMWFIFPQLSGLGHS